MRLAEATRAEQEGARAEARPLPVSGGGREAREHAGEPRRRGASRLGGCPLSVLLDCLGVAFVGSEE